MFRISTDMKTTVLALLLCMLGISLAGCTFVESASDLVPDIHKETDALKKDPSQLIGQIFEVSHFAKFAGLKTYKAIVGLRQATTETGRSAKTSFLELGLLTTEYTDAGLLTNLNTESNDEDKYIDLVFEVLELRNFDDKEMFLKINVLNKKYFDTKWWISSYDFWRLANRPKPGRKWKLPFNK